MTEFVQDVNIEGNDNYVAGRDLIINVQSIDSSLLAEIERLKKKLAIAEAANKAEPTKEEVEAAEEAVKVAGELEEKGAIFDPWAEIKLGNVITTLNKITE